jgi:hypothetical protein
MPDPTITILCSGVALGVYVPALVVSRQLRSRGLASEVVVLESLFGAEKQARILQNQAAFHHDFSVARMGQRMARDVRPSLDAARVERLYEAWLDDQRRLFIVCSGFWMPLLEAYRQRIAPARLWAHLLHMDAAVSASWSQATRDGLLAGYEGYQPIWLFNRESGGLVYQLIDYPEPVIPYDQRPQRYLIHGGGWGMGTYQSKIPLLEAAGLDLDIIAYEPREAATPRAGQRYFMVDPAWSPWHKNRLGEHEFPPMGEIVTGRPPQFSNRPDSHELLHLARQARAIISKPGGATLLDSWAAATPLVTLEPFGDYEAQNAALWQEQGFAIPFAAWQGARFAPEALEPLHRNLLRSQGEAPHYVEAWYPRFREYLLISRRCSLA